MIKIDTAYKEKVVWGNIYVFKRIIKYKHPKRIFRIKIEQTIGSTIDMGISEYVDKIREVLFDKEREKRTVLKLVRKDIEEREIDSQSRQQIIKESAFTMEIDS